MATPPWRTTFLRDSPLPLALLRIVVSFIIVASPELYEAPTISSRPERLAFVPEGLRFIARLPMTPGVVKGLQIVALSAAATAILGWMSRASMLVLTLSAGLLFSFSQRGGAVLHDMHLFWLAALLAASPCGDAWSLDAWATPRPAPAVRYGVPIALARLLLGLVYFFPGFHKLRASGIAWASAANVTNHMRAKWLENNLVPFLRIDHVPLVCSVGAGLVIVFEITFVVLALASPRTRWVAIASGLVFHAATQMFFFIRFTSLWSCYVVLLDGGWLERIEKRVLKRLGRSRAMQEPIESRDSGWQLAPALVLGWTLAIAVVVQGIRGQTQAWPFACYPTFEHLQGATIPDVVITLDMADGSHVTLTGRESRARSQAEWGHVFRISGAYGDGLHASALHAHVRSVLASSSIDPAFVARTRVYRASVSTLPESWNDPLPAGILLMEMLPPL